MFKDLYGFLEEFDKTSGDNKKMNRGNRFNTIKDFVLRIKDFAFYDDLSFAMQKDNLNLEDKLNKEEYHIVIDYLLNEKGLGYGKLPKGLLKFHRYKEGSRVPLEEHIEEAAQYGKSRDNFTEVHFTVSPEHLDKFSENVDRLKPDYEKKHGIKHNISFSLQKASTDTIAVDLDNNPFIDEDDSILFRPAGHGALIENLNDLEGDLIFIKNIDNVVPDKLKPDTTLFKKVIGGLLLKLQTKTFEFLRELEINKHDNSLLTMATEFAQNKLNITFPCGF